MHLCIYGYICILLRSCIKCGSVVSERVCSFSVFLFVSPTRPGYKEFNLATPTTPHGGRKERRGSRRSYQNLARGCPRETEECDDGQFFFFRSFNGCPPVAHLNPRPSSAKFSPPWRNLTQWRPLLPKEGGMIQVDIGGHPPIAFGPTASILSIF